MNETLRLIKNRYTCRNFTGNLPAQLINADGAAIDTKEILNAIAQAGVEAPSGMNRQAWRVIVVTNKNLIDEIEKEGLNQLKFMADKNHYDRIMARGGTLFYHAPAIFFLPIDPTELAGATLDCGIIAQNITLAAASFGLGTCICGLTGVAFKDPEKAQYFKNKLGFPEGFEFGIAVLVGESASETAPHTPDLEKISFVL